MRFIMVDRARARASLKRGDGRLRTTLTGVADAAGELVDILALEAALKALEDVDAVAADVVTMRVFGGLTIEEAAESLGKSPRTINKRWRYGRIWLAERLS
ncbi:MAG: DNA-directed RNA polymerase specialized sigma24 family protein [Myxococcota bacterium]|jgi:DNA-directed RNA polymerase specialized sigma24 family protein